MSAALTAEQSTEKTLARLRSATGPIDQARTFFYDPRFQAIAVKVQPGEFYVDREGLMLSTVLGSCVAACLYDSTSRLGGMNHFMVPDGDESSGRFGLFAMEQLVNSLVKQGAIRSRLQAKIFGGGSVIPGMASGRIGERNVSFVQAFLQREGIPVISSDVLGNWPRKLLFFGTDGRAMVKKLSTPQTAEQELERKLAERAKAVVRKGGDVELF